MSCSIASSYSTKIHDTNLLGNRTWSLEICQKSIGFEGKASINRKLIVYTIELLEGKSLTYHHVSCFSPSSCGSKMHQATFLLPVGWMIEHPKERDNT